MISITVINYAIFFEKCRKPQTMDKQILRKQIQTSYDELHTCLYLLCANNIQQSRWPPYRLRGTVRPKEPLEGLAQGTHLGIGNLSRHGMGQTPLSIWSIPTGHEIFGHPILEHPRLNRNMICIDLLHQYRGSPASNPLSLLQRKLCNT